MRSIILGLSAIAMSYAAPTQITKLPDQTLRGINVDNNVDLNQYFSGATNYYASLLSGTACLDDDTDNSCMQPFTLTASDTLFMQMNAFGTSVVEVTASDAVGASIKDTFNLVLDSKVPPYRKSSSSDLSYSYGFNNTTIYTYFTGATNYSVVSKKGIVNANFSLNTNSYFSLSSIPNKYGIDTLIVTASNSYGSAYDTIQVTVNAPMPPQRYSYIYDQSLKYGFNNTTISTYFTGATNYAVVSKKGIVNASFILNTNSYFTLSAIANKFGVDTLIVTASNAYGSAYDTIQVTVSAPPLPIVQVIKLPDVQFQAPKVDQSLKLPTYFTNATTYSVSVLSGTACLDDDNVNDCMQPFTLFSSDTLFMQMSIPGTAIVEVTASNGTYTVKDTLNLDLTNTFPPYRITTVSDISLNYGFKTAGLYSAGFANADSYTIKSTRGIVRPGFTSPTSGSFFVDSVYGAYGKDTLIIAATNTFGTSYDTIAVNVVNPNAPVTQVTKLPDVRVGSTGYNQILNLDQYFMGASSYYAEVLSGTACLDDDFDNSCLQPFTLSESKNLYLQLTSGTSATIRVSAKGSNTVYDTLELILDPTIPALLPTSVFSIQYQDHSLNLNGMGTNELWILNTKGQSVLHERLNLEGMKNVPLSLTPGRYIARLKQQSDIKTLIFDLH